MKFKAPKESADASPLDEDAPEVAGRSATVGEVRPLVVTEDTLCDAPCRGVFCFRSCKALAKAFSCVRTNVASCYVRSMLVSLVFVLVSTHSDWNQASAHTFTNNSPSSESMFITGEAWVR